MNASITIPARLRIQLPVWLLLLLLPVLPGLGLLSFVDSQNSDAITVIVTLDFIAGLLLALGLPVLLPRFGWPIRKEVEQLRGPWIASAFLVQVPMLFAPDGIEFALLLFTVTCALLAAIPFGAEFQQRTLSGLLCQPADRRVLWRRKIGVLLPALLLHGLLTAVTFAVQRPTPTEGGWILPGILLLIIGLAVCTTPWWSMVTRGILPGVVFSLGAPLAILFVFGMGIEFLRGSELVPERVIEIESNIARCLAFLVAPAYAILTAWSTRRRWLRLETPDHHALESGALFGGRLGGGTRTAGPATRRPPLRTLLVKECRLQTVTWVVAGLAIGLTVLWTFSLGREWSWFSRQYLAASAYLFAALGVLLAAATAIAEERRMGTLDPQLLLPISRARQWWIKTGVVAVVTLAMYLCVFALLQEANPPDPVTPRAIAFAVALAFASVTLFASSTATSTLRALVGGIALLVAAVSAIMTSITVTEQQLRSLGNFVESANFAADHWISEAVALGESRIEGTRAFLRAQEFLPPVGFAVLTFAVLVPVTLALYFSWRNFSAPAGHRIWRQAAGWLGVLLVLCVTGTLAVGAFARRIARDETLVLAWDTSQFRNSLPPAQLRLARHAMGDLLPLGSQLRFHVQLWTDARPTAPPGGAPRPLNTAPPSGAAHWEPTWITSPFSQDMIKVLVERARLPADLREALRIEAGLPASTSPIPANLDPDQNPALPQLEMNPDLARRYGLRGAIMQAAPPPATGAPAPRPAPVMNPELMRRYGLIPRPPTATTNLGTPPKPAGP